MAADNLTPGKPGFRGGHAYITMSEATGNGEIGCETGTPVSFPSASQIVVATKGTIIVKMDPATPAGRGRPQERWVSCHQDQSHPAAGETSRITHRHFLRPSFSVPDGGLHRSCVVSHLPGVEDDDFRDEGASPTRRSRDLTDFML